jgi:YVTN family beta-propeller protein
MGTLAGATLGVGCTPASTSYTARSSGSLALSSDDSTLYAVDTDNGVLAIVDLNAPTQKPSLIQVGKAPVRVVVGADDTIYVANRGDNTVSVVRKGAREVAATLQTGTEPTGLAFSTDGRQLLVTSATAKDTTAHGTLTAFDVATLEEQWSIPVGEEPRGVAVVAGNKALVSLYKKGEVAVVDLNTRTLVSNPSVNPVYAQANATRVEGVTTAAGTFRTTSTFHPRAAADVITTPDGTRAFTPVVWAREDAIARRPSSIGGYYGGGGPCSIGAVATAGIVTYDIAERTDTRVDDLTACVAVGANGSSQADFPVSTFASTATVVVPSGPPVRAVQGSTVGVTDPTGQWLFVVNRESQNVAVMPTYRRTGDDLDFARTSTSIRSLVGIGKGADGIAVTRDGTKAFVYSQFDHQIETIAASGRGDRAMLEQSGTPIRIAGDTLPADLVEGRKMFFDAIDTRMSAATTNVACSTCHLEGREDGHVWQFPDGPRQTPALAGRKLLSTAPFHWSGEFATIHDFNSHTIRERMGGSGTFDAAALDRWIDQLPTAPSPVSANLESAQRGRLAFEKAQCATCHTGALMTNNKMVDVGTLNLRGANRDNGIVEKSGFNVPSLLGLGRSAPYLHDGTERTLEDRVYANAGDKHGTTTVLSDAEKADLVVYLKSL